MKTLSCLLSLGSLFVTLSACNSSNSPAAKPAVSNQQAPTTEAPASVTTNSLSLLSPSEEEKRDAGKVYKSGDYVLKITFLKDFIFPSEKDYSSAAGQLVEVEPHIQSGAFCDNQKCKTSDLSCGIGYGTTADDLSFIVKSGTSYIFNSSISSDGQGIEQVTLQGISGEDGLKMGIKALYCQGPEHNFTVSNLVRAFGNAIEAKILTSADYQSELHLGNELPI